MAGTQGFFDSPAEQATSAPPTPYSGFFDPPSGSDTLAKAQAVTASNSTQNSDTAAAAAKLVPQVGLPQAAIETDVPRFQAQAQQQKNAAILSSSPVLASWVAANPDSARVAQSEYDKLSTIEKLWGGIKRGMLGAAQGLGGSVNELALALNRGVVGATNLVSSDAAAWLAAHTVAYNLENRSAFQPDQGSFTQRATAAAGQMLGLMSQVVLTGGTGEAGAAETGLQAVYNTVKTAGRAMMLPSLTAAVNTGSDVYDQTGDRGRAAAAAALAYGFTTLQGAVPLSAPGGLLSRLATGAASGVTSGELERQAMNAVLPPQMRQEFDPDQLVLNAITSAIMGGVMGPRVEPELQAAVRATYSQHADALRAADAAGRVQGLSDAVQGSKLKDAAPGALGRFVEMVTDGSPLEAVYVDPAKLNAAFAQSGVEPTPDLAGRIRDAAAASTDVRVSMPEYATQLAGTPAEKALLPEMRAAPDGMTFGEAEQHLTQATAEMQSKAEQLKAARAQRTAFEADKATVWQNLFDQLQATGRNPEAVNRAYATLIAEHYGALASREGVKPSELYKKLPLTIVTEGAGGLNQGPAERVTLDTLAQQWKDAGISASMSEKDGVISLDKIVVPKESRGQGMGTLAMQALAQYADETGQRIVLTPSKDFGASSVSRLKEFYKRFRFVENKGRNKDFTTMAGMIREPAKQQIDEATGLPLNDDGTVTMYHHTSAANAEEIRRTGMLKSAGEPDLYFTTTPEANTGYGDTVVPVRVKPSRLILDDEFPGGRSDYRVNAPARQRRIRFKDDGEGVLYQEGQRGAFDPAARTMAIMQHGDLSTVLHESGHLFLDNLERLAAGGSKAAAGDMDLLLKHFGEPGATPEERLATWAAKGLDDKRATHEKFAEGFEHYLMEGKAPSETLRTLFGRFRSWLLSVYQRVRGGVDPEVRGVMDRLLASDQAIREAEAQRGYAPLFDSAKAMGVDAEEFNRYVEQGRQATEAAVSKLQAQSLKDMKWASGAKSKALAALQRQADAARREVRGQVENDVAQFPAFQAQDWMRANAGQTVEFKQATEAWRAQRESQSKTLHEQVKAELYQAHPEATGLKKGQLLAKNRKAIDAEVQSRLKQWEEANPRPKPEDRSDLEFVAAMHGFESGAELRRAILEAGDREDIIRAETDRRMLAEHGELTDPQALEDAANAAVHNEARARFMATGLRALMKTGLSPTALAKAARAAAEAMISKTRIGELRSDVYRAAEARANREALEAVASKPAEAIEAQRRALLNNRLAAAAQDAQDEIAKGLKFLRRFDRPTPELAKKIGADYLDRINEILSRYDVTARFNSIEAQSQRLELRDWAAREFERTGVAPQIPDSILDFAARRHWKELSVEEFRGVVDAVKSLEHVGREQTQVEVAGQKLALDELVERAKADMAAMPHSDPVDIQPHLLHATGLGRINAQWLGLKSKVRGLDAALLKMEQLLQWLTHGGKAGLGSAKTGPFLEMFQRAADAEGAERRMRAQSVADLREIREGLQGVNIHESLHIPELPRPGRGAQWYREELIAAALNTGNESNLAKLTQGYGWNRDILLAALDKHLSTAEWNFVQGAWDAVGRYGDQIRELQRRQTGIAPPMIEARQVANSHGTFKGGYYPVVYDAFLDRSIDVKNQKNDAMLFENQFSQPTTSKGHTVARTGYVGPIHLSLGVIARHLDQVTHDLAWREPIADMNKFFSHKDIQREVDQVMGREYTKQFRPWLQAMANDKVFNTAGDSAWENFYRKVRTNATLVGLGFRMSTMMIHGASALSNSIGEIGPAWMAKGAAQFATPERWEAAKAFMYDRSPEMANRFNEWDRNLHEAIDEINAHQRAMGPVSATRKVVDNARKFAFYGISALDMGSAAPTWYGAYLKGMAPEAKGGHGMTEEEAVDFANRAVRNAHGGGGTKDLSAVQRDKGVMSLATMFYSYWSHMYNRQRDLFKGYANLPDALKSGTGTRDFAKLLARSWFYFVIPQLIHAMLKPAPAGQQPEDEAKHVAGELALGFVSGVPVLRDLASAAINGRDYTITPLEEAGKSIVKAATDAKHLASGEPTSPHAGRNVAQAIGYAAGLPTGQLSATSNFLWDVYTGDAQPQDIKDWYEGVQTGRLSP